MQSIKRRDSELQPLGWWLSLVAMPTILLIKGWRLFFFSDEGNEPMHVHARKAETECKFWIYPDSFEIEEVWSYNLTPPLRREIRQIIFDHFDIIVEAWRRHFGDKGNAND